MSETITEQVEDGTTGESNTDTEDTLVGTGIEDVEDGPADLPEDGPEDGPVDEPTNSSTDLPRHGPSSDLKTDRVFLEGQVDMNAVSETGADVTGNRYPQSATSARAEVTSIRGEIRQLQHELSRKIEEAIVAEAKAQRLEEDEKANQ